jgi:hypothetical protein
VNYANSKINVPNYLILLLYVQLMYCMTASEIGYWLDMFQTTYNRRGILAKSVPFDSIPSTELYERRPINLIFDGNVESAETELTALSPHPESLVVTTVDVENADILGIAKRSL